MNVIKSKEQQNIMKDLNINYRPHKRIQYCYLPARDYVVNMIEGWSNLCNVIITLLLMPLSIITSLYLAIRSLFPYSLTITKKELLKKEWLNMSRSIDLYSYDYNKLIEEILKVCNTDDKELVEKILLSCGNKIGDRYVILDQELWEDYNCYYNVATVLDSVFKVDDTFGKIFSSYGNEDIADSKELICAMSVYDILEQIGIEIED